MKHIEGVAMLSGIAAMVLIANFGDFSQWQPWVYMFIASMFVFQ
jgi:ABC-type uncharacterized transport system permease subunit